MCVFYRSKSTSHVLTYLGPQPIQCFPRIKYISLHEKCDKIFIKGDTLFGTTRTLLGKNINNDLTINPRIYLPQDFDVKCRGGAYIQLKIFNSCIGISNSSSRRINVFEETLRIFAMSTHLKDCFRSRCTRSLWTSILQDSQAEKELHYQAL